jgi:hypothetical protein
MPSRALADLIVALLHEVAGPHHSRRGGRRHRRSAVAPASPPPLSTLVVPHRRVLERPPSPSPDRPMNQVTPVHDPSSSIHQGEEEGGEEDDERQISVVTGSVGAPTIR